MKKEKENVSNGYSDLEFSRIDLEREHRTGFSEVIYAPGKTSEQIITITRCLKEARQNILVTRIGKSKFEKISQPDDLSGYKFDKESKCAMYHFKPVPVLKGNLVILSGGTSDRKVAAEARVTAEFFGITARCYHDVGIAGLHRLLDIKDEIRDADVIIAIAGMEGALPSVVAGLVSACVIAVPVSAGYGTGAGGKAALNAMLNSCAPAVVTVNIDNGFGAARAACSILRKIHPTD